MMQTDQWKTWGAVAVLAVTLAPAPAPIAPITSTKALVAAMQQRYKSSWYKTATFVQKTTRIAADGTPTVETWYEAMSVPGSLRIDFAPVKDGNGILFTGGKIFTFKDGKVASSRDYIHPLMLLGFDIYRLLEADVFTQLATLKFDVSAFHQDTWHGRPVYVVGAAKGDLQTAQFWIDQENLYFVRMLRPSATNATSVQDTEFNKYQRLGGGWMAPEVIFKVDGKVTTTEEYTELRGDITLDQKLFDPQFWTTVHWHEY
jgi:hypothetical protein